MAIKLLPDTEGKAILARLNNRYLKQAFMIGAAVILGIFLTHLLLRQLLVREALDQEAEYFWSVIEQNPAAPLPSTKNLRVYLLPRDGELLPPVAHQLHLGYHDYHHLEGFNVAYLTKKKNSNSDADNNKLLILFNRSGVDSLVLLFGIVPLTIALIFLYGSLFVSYRYSKKLLSPAIVLADKIKNTDLFNIDTSYFSASNQLFKDDDEVKTIAEAIGQLSSRLEQFIDRERSFTQDVSHELRSSITVIKMASELLASKNLEPSQRKLVDKLTRSSRDMEELTEFFLILAREESLSVVEEAISLNQVLDRELEKLSLLANEKSIPIHKQVREDCYLKKREKVLSVLVGNLLRNAILYTESGRIDVVVSGNELIIRDTGIGISKEKMDTILDRFTRDNTEQKGFGIGLSIVKRLCDRFNWKLLIDSQKHSGTEVRVLFFGRCIDEL